MPYKGLLKKKYSQTQQGFLLISVIVSMSVLAVLASVAVNLMTPGYQSLKTFQHLTAAKMLSQFGFNLKILSLSETNTWQESTENFTLTTNQGTVIQTRTQSQVNPNLLLLKATASYKNIQATSQRTLQQALP